MDHQEMMMDCIRQATIQGLKGHEARDEAAKMFALITGRSYESVIGTRLQTTTPPKAEVVGRDGTIPKFQDYLKDE